VTVLLLSLFLLNQHLKYFYCKKLFCYYDQQNCLGLPYTVNTSGKSKVTFLHYSTQLSQGCLQKTGDSMFFIKRAQLRNPKPKGMWRSCYNFKQRRGLLLAQFDFTLHGPQGPLIPLTLHKPCITFSRKEAWWSWDSQGGVKNQRSLTIGRPRMVIHTCNPYYSGRNRRITVWG
jgi:hypothetical protein